MAEEGMGNYGCSVRLRLAPTKEDYKLLVGSETGGAVCGLERQHARHDTAADAGIHGRTATRGAAEREATEGNGPKTTRVRSAATGVDDGQHDAESSNAGCAS